AGRMDSVQRSMDGLTAKALDLCFEGPAVSPSLVQQRIEALAACDVGLLLEVSRSWRPPDTISLDLMDEAADFWTCAWSSAMRFVSTPGDFVKGASGSLPYQVQREWDVRASAPRFRLR